ncbi:TonB-dependent receptor [Sandarakinorhabdus oryzae]|uniref:TonB-dependent receptor n=1 Tax=Sandarakinorhabdus oryzae TaxID=2675220 RepID=UPI0018CC04BB|nr:TonB-dependent receptor [Sandarakinorhabdus oryzae]
MIGQEQRRIASRRAEFIRLACATTMLAGLAAPALAAEDQASAAAEKSEGFEEIIVTATRTATSIQKVPISMQALSTETLANRQVKGLTDFTALLPSVSTAGLGPGRTEVYFRGIVPAGGAYPATGYYLDDISINVNGLPDVHIYDIERIEALSGPQGTLFGAGSLAGTLRVITNKPKIGQFEAGYDFEGNKFGKGTGGGQAQGFINVPISDTLAVRAMGYYRHEGGYIDNTPNNGKYNDGTPAVFNLGDTNPLTSFTLNNANKVKNNYNTIDEVGGRLSLLWEPADGWSINPQVTAQKQISRGYFGFDPRVGDLQVHDYDDTRQNDQWYQAQLAVHGHIGDFDLVSATGYFRRNIKLLNDYTYYSVTYDSFGPGYESYLQFFDKAGCTGSGDSLRCTTLLNPTQFYSGNRNERIFTQELRLKTPESWPFDVTFGGFYQYQKIEINDDYGIHGLGQSPGFTAACAYSDTEDCGGNGTTLDGFGVPEDQGGTMVRGSAAVKRDAFYLTEQNRVTRDYAIFAEGHYNITPTLKVTGGIRYFWTELNVVGFGGVAATARNIRTTYVPTGTGGCPLPLPAERLQCLNTNFSRPDQQLIYREQGETHKVALNWEVTPSKMVYANYSTGFRPGGQGRPLRIGGQVYAVAPFRSEDLINFEIGFKTTWNNIFRFNAAIYLEKWKDLQYGVVVSGAQGAGITGNAGNAEVKGIEFDADLKLGKVTISTAGSYNDGKLKGNFCNFAADQATLTIAQLKTCTVGAVLDDGLDTPEVAAADGTRLPRQPKFKGTTSVRYDTTLGKLDAYIQGAALYQTGATQDLNTELNKLLGNSAGFVSFDFAAGIKKDKWTLDLFIQNAFDRRGILTTNTFCAISLCANSSRNFPIRPQFFGIKFGQRF